MTGKRLLLSALVFGGLLGATGQIHADTSTSSSKASLLKTIKKAKSKTNKGYPKYYKFKMYVEYKETQIGGGRYNYYAFKNMKKVVKKADKVYKNSKASVESVNKVNSQLKTAIGNLIDHKSFYTLNNKFEALNPAKYTLKSFTKLADAEYGLFSYYNIKNNPYTSDVVDQKGYNKAVKETKAAFKHLKKRHITNKLWGVINKKTGKFYYNRDPWGQKVAEYGYLNKGKYKKQPYAYAILKSKDKDGEGYISYRLDTNHHSAIVYSANIDD